MIVIDEDIVGRLKEDDRSAFNQIFKAFFLPLCKYSYSIINEYEQSRELVQDIFIKLWENREDLDRSLSLKSYLFKIAHNKCLNHLRHLKVREKYFEYLELNAKDLYESCGDSLVESEIITIIDQTISSLPPKCQEAFMLSRFEGKKYKEIAEYLGVTQKTVETHISRALKGLRGSLKEFLVILLIILCMH